MKYEVLIGIAVKGKFYDVGSIVDTKVIPTKSAKWLLEQGIIKKITKAEQEKMLQEAVVDDYDTEFEEVLEEE